MKKDIINGAVVPKEEIERRIFTKVPTVNDILKKLNKIQYKVGMHEFLSDVFECSAIAISNKFDFKNFQKREEKYLNIINKYDKPTREFIAEIFADIFVMLSSQIDNGFKDYLGELYMMSETSNKNSGQFFTPYCISKLSAELVIDEEVVRQYIKNDEILTMNEPTCGSGGMILAAVDVLYNKYRFNYSRNLFVTCGDIDLRCVHMTYLQLSLAGIPAIIYHQDALTLDTWDVWETPPYLMQYSRFAKK